MIYLLYTFFLFFFNDPATTEIYTLSLHDALPISVALPVGRRRAAIRSTAPRPHPRSRSEEHTSELQSRQYLVCRLLLEKKKKKGQLDLEAGQRGRPGQGQPREERSRRQRRARTTL